MCVAIDGSVDREIKLFFLISFYGNLDVHAPSRTYYGLDQFWNVPTQGPNYFSGRHSMQKEKVKPKVRMGRQKPTQNIKKY